MCAARTLAAVHVAILSLFTVGWALPWQGVLVAVVVTAPVVEAGWWVFGDRCVLTLLEKRLRGPLGRRSDIDAAVDESPPGQMRKRGR